MKFTETKISGTWLVDMELLHDDRGFFSRAWCEEEFGAHGITKNLSQANLSLSKSAGTIRGCIFGEDRILK